MGTAGYGQKQGRTVGLIWFDGLLLTKCLISGEILTCLCENQLQLGETMNGPTFQAVRPCRARGAHLR